MIEVIAYKDEYHDAFRDLNVEWLDKYNLKESHDMLILNDPKGTIIDPGGYIWLAKAGEEIVGTSAIINEGHGIYELAKMAVAPAWQGKGISKVLIETCLQKAKEIGAKKIILFSNSQLQTALGLYKKYGFEHVEVSDAPFLTADVKMELTL
jgi:putative acetyltransferase